MNKKCFVYLPAQMMVTNQTQNVYREHSAEDDGPGFRPVVIAVNPDDISTVLPGLPEPMAEIEDEMGECVRLHMKNSFIHTIMLDMDEVLDILNNPDAYSQDITHARKHWGGELFQDPHIFDLKK